MTAASHDLQHFMAVAAKDRALNWFAIADSAQEHRLPGLLKEEGGQAESLFDAPHGSPLAQQTPHLVSLPTPLQASRAWKWISKNGGAKPCVSVIATTQSFGQLFNHFRNLVQVVLPDDETLYFAFWDPAILATLIGQPDDLTLHVRGPVLADQQKARLTRRLEGWWYWDRHGKLHSIDIKDEGRSSLDEMIKLNQQQVDDLIEASVPDHVLYYVELNQPLLVTGIPERERYDLVRGALVRARTLGLIGMRDLVNFVCLSLIYRGNMNEDPVLRRLLADVKEKKLTLTDAVQLLPK